MNTRDCCIVLRCVQIHPRLCQRKGGVVILDNIIDRASCDLLPRAAFLDLYCFVLWLLLGSAYCGALALFYSHRRSKFIFIVLQGGIERCGTLVGHGCLCACGGDGFDCSAARECYTSLFPCISLISFVVCSLSVIPLSLTFRTT